MAKYDSSELCNLCLKASKMLPDCLNINLSLEMNVLLLSSENNCANLKYFRIDNQRCRKKILKSLIHFP